MPIWRTDIGIQTPMGGGVERKSVVIQVDEASLNGSKLKAVPGSNIQGGGPESQVTLAVTRVEEPPNPFS